MVTIYGARGLILAAIALLSLGTTAQNLESCPGYRASNVVSTGSTLTADLALNGPACNVYGTDLTDLKLVVEYQTGMNKIYLRYQRSKLTLQQILVCMFRYTMLPSKSIRYGVGLKAFANH